MKTSNYNLKHKKTDYLPLKMIKKLDSQEI